MVALGDDTKLAGLAPSSATHPSHQLMPGTHSLVQGPEQRHLACFYLLGGASQVLKHRILRSEIENHLQTTHNDNDSSR